MKTKTTNGPNEQAFMSEIGSIPKGYEEELEKFPEHREFIFEQLLKVKNNLEEYQHRGDPDYFDPTSKTNTVVWFAMFVAFFAMMFVFMMK